MKKKILPSIRIDERTYNLMLRAVDKFNETSLLTLSLQELRRLSYETLSRIIIEERDLPVKLTKEVK